MAIGANMTQREQALVGVGVLGIAIAIAFWYFIYNPKGVVIDAMTAHVDSVETLNRQARVDLTKGTSQHLLAEAAEYESNLRFMRELVPNGNEVSPLLESISTAARRVGLDLASVEPAPVIIGDQFDTYRYKLSVMGNYHAIARFLSNVGSLDRIVAPVGLDLKVHPSDKTKNDKPGMIDATFQVQTYVTHGTGVPALSGAVQ